MWRVLWIAALASAALAQDGKQQTAPIGDLKLQSGEVIRDCRIGFRTFGKLNSAKSNAVLFPTWFTGRSGNLIGLIGPGKLVDSSRYYVIAVDALGDGISSSPSNSASQPRMRFPKFTIRDMVSAEHQFVTQTLHLDHLHAVVGISMGGMQTFQWLVSYPEFMDRAVPIVGSPKLTAYDLLLWKAEEHAIEEDANWKNGDYTAVPAAAMRTVLDIHALNLTTPSYQVAHTPEGAFDKFLHEAEALPHFDTNDWLRQLQAMMAMDVGGGHETLEQAAVHVKARVLVIVGMQDHMVNPAPALRFAKALKANTLEIDSDCGHLVTGCAAKRIGDAIATFLQ